MWKEGRKEGRKEGKSKQPTKIKKGERMMNKTEIHEGRNVGVTWRGGAGRANSLRKFFLPKNELVSKECVLLGLKWGKAVCVCVY